jgi:uncharacterized membrane protein YqaE (UPF0057 family)
MKTSTTRFILLLVAVTMFSTPLLASSITSQPISGRDSSMPDKAVIDAALNEFKHLDRKERKTRLKSARQYYKEYRSAKRSGKSKRETDQTLLIILCILLPPLAVYLKEDDTDSKFWISVLLTLLFWLPGIIYALLVVFDEV